LRERVLAIVSIIAQYIMEATDHLTESDIVEKLLAVGFQSEEIDAAFSWMENLSLQSRKRPAMTLAVPTHRVFTPDEIRVLSSEARGFLVRLRALGILDDEMQEEIIENAIHASEDEVTLKEVKTMAILTLNARQGEWWREVDCIMEDDWSRLYH
jgi:Smg protein